MRCSFCLGLERGVGGGPEEVVRMEGEKQWGQPCQPWDQPWLATAAPPLEWRSTQPGSLSPPWRCLARSPTAVSSSFLHCSGCDRLFPVLCSGAIQMISSLSLRVSRTLLKAQARRTKKVSVSSLFPLYQWSPDSLPHQMTRSVKLLGVNMWALSGLKYHSLPGKQRWCRQPCRLVTSLFFDPATLLQ